MSSVIGFVQLLLVAAIIGGIVYVILQDFQTGIMLLCLNGNLKIYPKK